MREKDILYREDLVLKSDARTQKELFKEIGNYLFEKNLVTKDFARVICERESQYPTGIDLSVVDDSLPNVAIPHTESKYCKARKIVFVKLNQDLLFNEMIKPDESVAVRYLFFILNDVEEKQSTILSDLMEFITNPEHLEYLEKLYTKKDMYKYLISKQRMDHND